MKRIWGVASGEYSDYRVLFLCSSEEVAAKAAAELRADDDGYRHDASVEEFALYDASPEQVKVYTMQCLVRGANVSGAWGRTPEPSLRTRSDWEWDTIATRRPTVKVWRAPMTGPDLNLSVEGTSRAAVLKAYSDRLTQILATPEDAR